MSQTIKPTMILCSEARVTDEIADEIKIAGYNEIVCASKSRFTGGVVIYIRENLRFKNVFINSVDATFWCLSIEITNSHMNGIYSVFYRANKARFLKNYLMNFCHIQSNRT